MRNALREVLDEVMRKGQGPHHAGLAHERWAPLKPGGTATGGEKDKQKKWDDWLEWLEKSHEPDGYAVAFKRWRDSLRHSPTVCFQARAASRLLVGHGNPAPTGVGLTLHHTWGVPVLPGSALKGLLSGYVQALFGPVPGEEAPEPERTRFQGVAWRDARPVREPGELYRRLFGAPEVEGARHGAHMGQVIFHDALWVSERGASATRDSGSPPEMLARDVLTVHQKNWYGSLEWPSDHDDPNPVRFLTVRPGSRFLVALSLVPGTEPDGADLLHWAGKRLREALAEWGLGGKTAAGYGRLEPDGPLEVMRARPVARRSAALTGFQDWLARQKEAGTSQRELIGRVEAEWRERLLALPPDEREECRRLLKSVHVRKPELKVRMQELLTWLGEKAEG